MNGNKSMLLFSFSLKQKQVLTSLKNNNLSPPATTRITSFSLVVTFFVLEKEADIQ
jgi:hypothetical protein